MNLQKILTIVIALISAVGLICWVMIITQDDNEGIIGMTIGFGKMLVYAAAIIALGFSLKNIVTDPNKLKKAGISLIALIAVLALGYGLASGTEYVSNTGEVMATESESKWVGTGLYVFYSLAIISIIAMVLSGVKKALNK